MALSTAVAISATLYIVVTISLDSFTTTTAVVWLTGDLVGSNYNVKVQATTLLGRIKDCVFGLAARALEPAS
jgi:hypothetical protein